MSMSCRSRSKSLTGDIPPVTKSTGLCNTQTQFTQSRSQCQLSTDSPTAPTFEFSWIL